MIFRVWSPLAKRMEVEVRGQWHEMSKIDCPPGSECGNCWQADVQAGHGDDYRLRIDGSEPLSDPRSPWQPQGVHGPSRVLDHARFAWRDNGWNPPPLSSAVLYELHVGTFSPEGTFEGVIGKLDYLRDLSVTHVELLPVAEFSGRRGWGYDGVDLYAPHHAYGGPEGLKRLVDACHLRGLAVVLDVVYNHFGPDGCYLRPFGPYTTDRYHTPWGEALNFDGADCEGVRRFVIDNALMWLRDYHIDALRLDGLHAIIDTSAVHIVEDLARAVGELQARLGKHKALIGETDLNQPHYVEPLEAGGLGLDAHWVDDFHHALHTVITGEQTGYYMDFGTLEQLAKAFRCAYVYTGQYAPHRRRRHGRMPIGLSGHHFVTYLQNHDQVGNRAIGDRVSDLVRPDRVKVGSALLFASPLLPMLFQGQEWSASSPFQFFADFEDEGLRKAVSEGRRREFAHFGWDPAQVPDPCDKTTYERSCLNWGELDQPAHADMLAWHKALIRLRRRCHDLNDGRLDRVRTRFDEQAGWIAIERGQVTVLCNLAKEARHIPLAADRPRTVLIESSDRVRIYDGAAEMPGESVVILGENSTP